MITKDNLKTLLFALDFEQNGDQYSKKFAVSEAYLKVDFDKNLLIYPEEQGLKIHERQTCNFSANENFVVFEPRQKAGHFASLFIGDHHASHRIIRRD